MNNYKIYILTEPDNAESIRYCGYTKNTLECRLKNHLRKSNKSNMHKKYWIDKLKRCGKIPLIKLVEDNLTFDNVIKKEIFYIKLYKIIGCDLTNQTDGGEGTINYQFTSEQRLRMRERSRGEKNPMFGKKHSKETREKISLANKGKIGWKKAKPKQLLLSLKFVRIGPNKGKKFSEEHKRKISESITGEKNPFYGKKHTEEYKKWASESRMGIPNEKLKETRKRQREEKLTNKNN